MIHRDRSRRGSRKLLWSSMLVVPIAADVRIEAREVLNRIRSKAYRLFEGDRNRNRTPKPEPTRGQASLYSILLPRDRHGGCIPQSLRWRVLDPHIGEAQGADLGYVVGCTSSDTGRRGRVGEVKHREQLTQMRARASFAGDQLSSWSSWLLCNGTMLSSWFLYNGTTRASSLRRRPCCTASIHA